MLLKASQISTIINEIYDGVERSKAGKILGEKEINGVKGIEIHHVGFQTYIAVLNSMFPKNFDTLKINVKDE